MHILAVEENAAQIAIYTPKFSEDEIKTVIREIGPGHVFISTKSGRIAFVTENTIDRMFDQVIDIVEKND